MSTFYDDVQTSDENQREEEEAVEKSYEILAKTYKIIIIGDSNVGKTCLAYRFCTGKFPERTETTIGVDFWEKTLELNGEPVKLQLWDTAGQERFRKSMVIHYYRNVSAVVFMYDITRLTSFEALTMWLQEYNLHGYGYGVDVPKILIGNKCDLGPERVVSSNAARRFADHHNMPLWEISTKNDAELQTIESILLTLTHKLVKHKPLMDKERTRTTGEDESEAQGKNGTRRSKRKSGKRIKLKHQTPAEKKKCCNS